MPPKRTTSLFFCVLLLSQQALASPFVISGGKDPDNPSTQYLISLYSQAFARIGHEFSYLYLPNKRSSFESDRGKEIAGELSRVKQYGSTHPDMARLDTPHYTVKFLVLGAEKLPLNVTSWQDLKSKNLRITYRIGTQIIEENIAQYSSRENLTPIPHTYQGIKMLTSERADIFIEGSVNLAKHINQNKLAQLGLKIVGQVEEVEIYLFLHRNYHYLIPQLNAVLKAMKEEGLLQPPHDAFISTADTPPALP